MTNPRVKQSKKQEADDRPNSITVNIPPLGMAVFSYIKPTAKTEKAEKPKAAVKAAKPEKAGKAGKDQKDSSKEYRQERKTGGESDGGSERSASQKEITEERYSWKKNNLRNMPGMSLLRRIWQNWSMPDFMQKAFPTATAIPIRTPTRVQRRC